MFASKLCTQGGPMAKGNSGHYVSSILFTQGGPLAKGNSGHYVFRYIVFNEWSTGHGLFTHRGHFYTKQIQKDKSIIFVAAEPKNI